MRTLRLPVVDWTEAPAYLNGLVRFAERRNMVSARVPSHFKRSLLHWSVTDRISKCRAYCRLQFNVLNLCKTGCGPECRASVLLNDVNSFLPFFVQTICEPLPKFSPIFIRICFPGIQAVRRWNLPHTYLMLVPRIRLWRTTSQIVIGLREWCLMKHKKTENFILIYFNIDYTLIQKSCRYAKFLMTSFVWRRIFTDNAYRNENYENSLSHED